MDTNKILSADLLDLIFDDRNKEYGAYELRKTYQRRITKSLIFTVAFISLTCTGVVLANKLKPDENSRFAIRELTLEAIKQDKEEPKPIPEPQKPPEPVQVQTERLTQIVVAPDEEVVEPPPTKDELDSAQIGLTKIVGAPDVGIESAPALSEGIGKGLIEEKTKIPDGPFERVEIDAIFDGNWEKFLVRTLNAQTPVENNAPAGNYKVLIRFVVDIDGTVSDIKPLTSIGYGLEEEAIRVLKKAKNWIPAIQNGHQVKAYRIQAITFLVNTEE